MGHIFNRFRIRGERKKARQAGLARAFYQSTTAAKDYRSTNKAEWAQSNSEASWRPHVFTRNIACSLRLSPFEQSVKGIKQKPLGSTTFPFRLFIFELQAASSQAKRSENEFSTCDVKASSDVLGTCQDLLCTNINVKNKFLDVLKMGV